MDNMKKNTNKDNNQSNRSNLRIHSKNKRTGKKMTKIGRALMIVLIVIAVLFAALVCAVYALFKHYYGLMDYTDVSQETVIEGNDLKEYLDGLETASPEDAQLQDDLKDQIDSMQGNKENAGNVINILLIGMDDSGVTNGSVTYDGSKNTDSMIICTINPKNKKIILTSLMRDTLAEVARPNGSYVAARLNTAYAFGGYSGMFKTIDRNFGIECDKFVGVNFASFMDIVNIVGGVDIYVTREEAIEMNNVLEGINELYKEKLSADKLKDTSEGTKHLNGKQALAYARIRYLKGSDFGRTERQRKLIIAVASKLNKLSVSKLDSLLKTLLSEISTNFTPSECAEFIATAPAYLKYEIVSMRIPADGTYEDVVLNNASMLKVDLRENNRLWKEAVYGTDTANTGNDR